MRHPYSISLPAAIRWDALSCWLDPANRSAFVSLWLPLESAGRILQHATAGQRG